MGALEVQAVFDMLYAFGVKVSRATGVRMPLGLAPQYPYGQADIEAFLSQVLTDRQAFSWRASELWRRDAEGANLASRELLPSCSTSGR